MTNLWSSNTPALFWQCQAGIADDAWLEAARQAAPVLDLPHEWADFDSLLALVLGEAQFGPDHWQLSRARRLYYRLKPFIPRRVIQALRQQLSSTDHEQALLQWPVEPRFARSQWELMRQLLLLLDRDSLPFINFWPHQKQFAFVLTHDIESAAGQANVRAVADRVEAAGFRSMFNFVPERYPLDHALIAELKERGFEVGVHGLTHDGHLFSSYKTFQQRAARINHYLAMFDAAGFRSPSTLRHPEWMQDLAIAYDLSFFDTDPYEPVAGGTMSIWPFTLGRFLELPYTLAQDYTLATVLQHTTPQLWLDKVAFIERYHGMALVNVHPDYLLDANTLSIFDEFLQAMRQRNNYWHALPGDIARWWQQRTNAQMNSPFASTNLGHIHLNGEGIRLVTH